MSWANVVKGTPYPGTSGESTINKDRIGSLPDYGQGRQRAKSAATRGALIATARALFTKSGYHQTNTTELVEMASVTRGALYHHFADKKDLFEAVFRQVFDEVQKRTNAAAAAQPGDLWDKTVAATVSNLQIRADDLEAQRILMVEGPAVLGWERWRALQEGVLEDFTGTIRKLMDQGRIAQGPARALAGQIIAALVDAALSIAHSDDHSTELETQREAFLALFEGLQTKA